MPMIYEPKGMAREYAELAVNLYRGCGHGCLYCYAPAILRMGREEFQAAAVLREGVLEALRKEAPAAAASGKRVLLCFTCDPYAPGEEAHQTTRSALEILAAAGCKVEVLTKAGRAACRDFDLLQAYGGWFGTSLSWARDADRRKWEPRAATLCDRILAIMRAHALGIRTWVSIEPVIDPGQALRVIRTTAPYVDEFRVGRWNHDARAEAIDWGAFVAELMPLLEETGRDYLVKEGLRPWLPEGVPAVKRAGGSPENAREGR